MTRSRGGGGGFVGGDPTQQRSPAKLFRAADDQLAAVPSRIDGLLASAWRGPPGEIQEQIGRTWELLRRVRVGCQDAAAKLEQVAERLERAAADPGDSAGFGFAAAASTLAAGLRRARPMREPVGGRPQPSARDRTRQGRSDANRILDKLRSGLFRLSDPEGARRILERAAERSRTNPEYAAGFLKRLGPKGFRKLIDDGTMDPCDLSAVVASASAVEDRRHQPVFGSDFLDEALGKNRGDAAGRAAVLGGCTCPDPVLHPEWTARMVEVLYRGPDVSTTGDSRRWFRTVGADLIAQLDHVPAGLAKEAEDALERIVLLANEHPLDPAGKLALARLLARPDTIGDVAERLAGGPAASPKSAGFRVSTDAMRRVLADLAADAEAAAVLNEAAGRYASTSIAHASGPFLTNPDSEAALPELTSTGALFGALASRSYDLQAAVDAAGIGRDAAKDILKHLAGVTFDAAKQGLPASIAIEGGKSILFAFGSDAFARSETAKELAKARTGQMRREALQERLAVGLHHMAFVSLLADPTVRPELNLKLSPADFPETLPRRADGDIDPLLGGFESVQEWRDLIFKGDQLVVPDPNIDGLAWDAFRAWARYVNPDLSSAAHRMHSTMMGPFDQKVTRGQ